MRWWNRKDGHPMPDLVSNKADARVGRGSSRLCIVEQHRNCQKERCASQGSAEEPRVKGSLCPGPLSGQSLYSSRSKKMAQQVVCLPCKNEELNWPQRSQRKLGIGAFMCNPRTPTGRWKMESAAGQPAWLPWQQPGDCVNQGNRQGSITLGCL